MLTTASLAVSRQMLHSNAALWSLPPVAPDEEPAAPSLEDEAVALMLTVFTAKAVSKHWVQL